MPPTPRQITNTEERRLRDAQQRLEAAETQARELVQRALAARDREIFKAADAGASLASIGRAVDLTRQAVGVAVQRHRQRERG